MDDERAEYLRTVEQRFVALRGRGFMLSPRDVALVERWRAGGVPVRIVLRALEDGFRAFVDRNSAGAPLPTALAYFENQVDKAALLWRERTMSWSPATAEVSPDAQANRRTALLERAMAAVTEAGQLVEEDTIKAVLRDVWRRLRQSVDRDDEEPWALIARLDRDMVGGVEAVLDSQTRATLRANAEAHVSLHGGTSMSATARATRIEETLITAIRERVGLPDLVQVVADVDV
ncbi:MAG: hypothetical protein QF464_19275 [Myxococcota bacterium]|jgi:hypothetical protein|nr:hypothetical protein [Myxococcota bacterium]